MLQSRLLVVRCGARLLLASAAVTYSAWVPALGLGEITLHSALNQPLRADIALVGTAGLAEGELSVRLATADEFMRAGVERVFFLNDLTFTPILRGDRSLIRVSSKKPVKEPYLDFLVQLDQPNGRLLREYTVLIDPPGAADIAPIDDEPPPGRPSSAFPSVQPTVAPPPVNREALATPVDPLAEQLVASVLHSQQLQASLDELNAKLQAQDEQIAVEKKQATELQTRLSEVQQAPTEPVAVAPAPAPVVVEERGVNWLWMLGFVALLALALLLAWGRRQRQQDQALPEPSQHDPQANPPVTQGGQTLQEVRSPQLSVLAPVAVATSTVLPPATPSQPSLTDEFQLNLDDLSMDTNWDLGPMENTRPCVATALPEPEIEWTIEPTSLDDKR
ncbi:FimV family protein [Pseudomonas sp. NPDC087336]|uniref:type IV pilus assembly protein FimV n=1 Tax=Pseudomonas sp. NPDC087336 TaxID=3364436 RepID=UPI00381742FC